MFQAGTDWNPLQGRLKEIILKQNHFEEAKQLLLKMHSFVHSSSVHEISDITFMDEIWKDLSDKAFRTMPTIKDDTIAWHIWHITRIEDLTANYLIANQTQVFDETWAERLHTVTKDTGNTMSDPEIISFSNEIDRETLYEYRNAVGRQTKRVIEELKPEAMRRKVSGEGLRLIAESGGVTNHPDSAWLLDFWGRKNIAGIFQMPITRHQIVHLNDCRRLKKICK